MKIIKILGIAVGIHALVLILIFANPGCSSTKAADAPASPISSAPDGTGGPVPQPAPGDSLQIRFSPTRPGTAVASALEAQPVSDVTPATTYTVVRGDTLSAIASKNRVSKTDLMSANNLKSTSILHIGQKLIISSKAAKATASAAPAPAAENAAPAEKPASEGVKHIVRPGETLGAIARKYGVRQGDIAVANNITDPRRIQPGQELVIPARSAGSAKQAKAARASADTGGSQAAPDSKPPAAQGSDQDLDAGLKPSSAADVPVIKIDDPSQAKNP